MRARASILIGLLWCVVLLAVVVIGSLHSTRMDLRVAKNHGDLIQAHYLALAGIEKAKAVIFHDAAERRGMGRNHTAEIYDAPHHFRDITLGRGQFRIIRQARAEEGGGLVYGVQDEESRLNLNKHDAPVLGKLPGLSPEAVQPIIAYRNEMRPFRTIRELLLVPGISNDILLGEDANMNGLLDPEENDGLASLPPDNQDGILDSGLADFLTLHGAARNLSAYGKDRVNVQEADENTLQSVDGITAEIAKAIVQYRGQNQLQSIADLLDVTAGGGNTPQGEGGQQRNQARRSQSSGPRVIDEGLFKRIADAVTTNSERTQNGLVNVNTASASVLACLPGVNQDIAQAIVSHRQSNGFFESVAGLLEVSGMTRELFKEALPHITARSETFRILSEGKVASTGARKRIQVIVQLGAYDLPTLSYREDL
jgi:competence ComEA-like helix-hairpin-helix protein